MNFLSQVAGTHSALALYDIGSLQLLYITYLPSATSMQTTLWQTRAKFEPRNAGGGNFYVLRDPGLQKEGAPLADPLPFPPHQPAVTTVPRLPPRRVCLLHLPCAVPGA